MSVRARPHRRPGARGTRAARLRRADARDDVLDSEDDLLLHHRGVNARPAAPQPRRGHDAVGLPIHLATTGAAIGDRLRRFGSHGGCEL